MHAVHVATTLTTEQLLLRRWLDEDRVPFASMNADHASWSTSRRRCPAESDALIDVFERRFDPRGFGLWALERRDTGAFIGFTGLANVPWDAHFTPAIEVGWRLAPDAWGPRLPD